MSQKSEFKLKKAIANNKQKELRQSELDKLTKRSVHAPSQVNRYLKKVGNSKTTVESSIKTKELVSKINEYNRIQEKIKMLE